MLDLRILNGTVVTDGHADRLDVGIAGGLIAAVEPQGALGPARAEIDATGRHVLPGAIDVHFHCRAPGHPHRGDFSSETRAAAAGGVTTVFEMPISDPACSTPEVFRARRALAEAQAHVNFALYSGAALTRAQAAEMAELGAVAFKLFTKAPMPGREREFSGLWATGEGAILDALEAVATTGCVCVVHAENEGLLRHFRVRADGGPPANPPIVEALAITSVAALGAEAGARIHIAHVSSREALAAVRAARVLHPGLTAETCPQYLLLDAGAVERHGGAAKIAPPLREPADRYALWDALVDGTLALVASDHSPFPVAEKLGVDFAHAPQGLPTVELLVPALLDAAARGLLPLELAVARVTSVPARLFGLSPHKGTISEGADADIAIASLATPYTPAPDTLLSRAADCGIVFEHMTLTGRVGTTIVGGQVVFRDQQIVGEPAGRFVTGGLTLEQV